MFVAPNLTTSRASLMSSHGFIEITSTADPSLVRGLLSAASQAQWASHMVVWVRGMDLAFVRAMLEDISKSARVRGSTVELLTDDDPRAPKLAESAAFRLVFNQKLSRQLEDQASPGYVPQGGLGLLKYLGSVGIQRWSPSLGAAGAGWPARWS